MKRISIFNYNSKFGELIIGELNGQICLCDWRYRKMRKTIDARIKVYFNAEFVFLQTELINKTVQQLEEYFSGERKIFTIPVIMAGTDFQQQVWKELQKIDYGQIRSYIQLASVINNKPAVRAVAAANGANAIAIIIPCHRIIGNNGDLIGYAGGLPVKKKLLELEGYSKITATQVKLFEEYGQ